MSVNELRKSLPLHRIKLDNGLDVIIIESKKIPVVSLNIAYKVGSKNEVQGKTGMAHLFEHLMFEGSRNTDKGDFDKLCSMAGGTNNAYTSFDLTCYTMTLPSHQLELGLWLESDRISQFSVSSDALKTQKKVVTQEIYQTVNDQPYGRWREYLSKKAYSDTSSYSWEVHGSVEDVKSVKLNDLKEFFTKFYNPSNASLVLCGDLEKDNTLSLVEKYFGQIPKRQTEKHDYSNVINFDSHTIFEDSVALPATFIAFHCPGFIDDKVLIADIISNIAANGRSSELNKSLVYEQQIASNVGSYVDKRELSSLIIFYAIANNANIDCEELAQGLYSEIKNMISKIDNNKLNKTVNQLTTQIAYEYQFASGLADNAAQYALFFDNPEKLYTAIDDYKQFSKDEIINFAKEILDESKSIRIDAIPKKI